MAAPSVTFWTLYHSFLRAGNDEEGKIRARKTCAWMASELSLIQRYLTPDEHDILIPVYKHWQAHGDAPGLSILQHVIAKQANPTLEEHLKDYEDLSGSLIAMEVEDIPALLATKIEEFKQDKLETLLNVALKINREGAQKNKVDAKGNKTKVTVKGPEEALHHIINQIDKNGLGGLPTSSSHGRLQDSTVLIQEIYEENADPSRKKNQRIYTGLSELDKHCQMRKGNFVGILAFAKQGKTHFVRTLCYNAALSGANVLHYTLEQSFKEELTHYAVIHSWNPKWGRKGIDWGLYHAGGLKKEDKDWFMNEVVPDLQDEKNGLPGNLYIQCPTVGTTWEAIRSDVVMRDRSNPLDMVMVDYLALIKTGKYRKEEVEEAIADVQNLAMTHRDNEGLLFATPVQGNRDGFADAGKNEGVWEMEGIHTFSAFERYLDLCFTMFGDAKMRQEHKRVVASVLNRRGPDCPPTTVAINHSAGFLQDIHLNPDMGDDKDMDDLLDEIR